jgi:hypothetical protein
MIEIKKTNPELWKYVDSLEDHLEVICASLLEIQKNIT